MITQQPYFDPYQTLSPEELKQMKPFDVLKYLIEINSKRIEDTIKETQEKYPKLFKNFKNENKGNY